MGREEFFRVLHDGVYRDILHAGHVILPFARTFVDAAGVAGLGRLDEDVLAVVRVKGRHGARAEHRDDGHVHGDADVHRAGVGREEERAAPQEACEHGQADLAREDVDMLLLLHLRAAFLDERHVGRAAHEGDVVTLADEAVGAGGKVAVEPALRLPARADVEGDDLGLGREFLLPECGGLCLLLRRQHHLEAAVVDGLDTDGLLEHVEVAEHLMLDEFGWRVGHGAVRHDLVKEALEAGLRVADDALAAREGSDGRSAFIAVEVDDEVEVARADLPDEAHEGEEALVPAVLVDEDALIEVLIAAHEVAERLVRQERDVRLGVVRPQRAQGRRHEHEVADVHRVDDEDILVHRNFLLDYLTSDGDGIERWHEGLELRFDLLGLDDSHAVVAERADALHALAAVAVDDEQVLHLPVRARAMRIRRPHEHDGLGADADSEMRRTRVAADDSRRLLEEIGELLEVELADEVYGRDVHLGRDLGGLLRLDRAAADEHGDDAMVVEPVAEHGKVPVRPAFCRPAGTDDEHDICIFHIGTGLRDDLARELLLALWHAYRQADFLDLAADGARRVEVALDDVVVAVRADDGL